MTKKIPTYSICNLLSADRCMTEFFVTSINDFVAGHRDLYFPHRHDFYQIVLFTHGGGKHSIDFMQYDVEPRQVYYMSPGQVHIWEFTDDTAGYIVNFHASFFSSALQNKHFIQESPLFNTVSGMPLNRLDSVNFGEVEQYFRRMITEFESAGDFKPEMLRSLLTVILITLARETPNIYRTDVPRHNMMTMRQFEKLIELHFREKRLPKSYAEMLFMSPNHLNALTNTMTGKSAGNLIRDRVLLEAKRLLVNSDLLVGQIADQLNFEDNAYFARFFKKYTGSSPEIFRTSFMQTVSR